MTQQDPGETNRSGSQACDRMAGAERIGAGALGLLYDTRSVAPRQTVVDRIDGMEARDRQVLLKSWALAEGFDRVGIAVLGVAPHGEAFEQWLARGDHAGMVYLERRLETRLDPRQILPGARSAVCVALQYSPLRGEASPTGDLWPHVARYARGRDYHDVMGRALERLASRIRLGFPGSQTRAYVDTGPVLERELAAQAGLGAVGKNTNLLDPTGGSWFLLGELFTTLELEGDSVVSDLCGSCSECLRACPTDALPEPYRLDSRRCISYWTIEHRGVIPEALRESIGSWVFGCDICQEVCPINAAAAAGDHPQLRLGGERSGLQLADLLGLDPPAYASLFRDSPLKRAKLEGLQRNAAVAMGNSRAPRHVPELIVALNEATSVVRRHVAWALGRIGDSQARQALQAAMLTEEDQEVRSEIAAALELAG